jgi:ribonuclease Z
MLAQQIARITTGQKVAYVTDTGFTPANKAKIIRAANHADHLFIEAAFLERDCRAAARKYHLTAYQAGYLAAAAHVKDFTVFHFSPRYIGQADAIYKEARTAFRDNQNK